MDVLHGKLIARLAAVTTVLVALGAPGAVAAGEVTCTVSVAPASGVAGTIFMIEGSGFGSPVEITFEKDGVEVRTDTIEELDDPATGGFSLAFEATAGDEGEWSVLAVLPESECGDEATFTVTALPDTARASLSGQPSTPAAPALALLAIAGSAFLLALRLAPRR